MKLRILIALVLLTGSRLFAVVDSTNGIAATNQSLGNEILGGATDTIIVKANDTLTIDSTIAADPAADLLFIRVDGYVDFRGSGVRANFNGVRIGGEGGAPFASSDGGILAMGPNDTLGLYNGDVFADGYDLEITGASAKLNPIGTAGNRAVIMGQSASDRPIIQTLDASSSVDAQYCKFYRLGSSTSSPGVFLGNFTPRTNDNFYNCIFDSAGLQGVWDGMRIDACTLLTTQSYYKALNINDGDGNAIHDTIWDCYVRGHNESSASQGPTLVQIGADSCTISGSVFETVGTNGENGRSNYAILCNDIILNRLEILNTDFGGTVWGFASLVTGVQNLIVDGCNITYTTHEAILSQTTAAADSGWYINENVFWGNGFQTGSGYSALQFEINTSEFLGHVITYNTFCQADTGASAIHFRNQTATKHRVIGNVIAGNIMIGQSPDYDIFISEGSTGALVVECIDYKRNAYSSIQLETVNDSLIIAGLAYVITDSNSVTGVYDFIDSVTFDFRLSATSPMINAGDSIYWVDAFPLLDPATAPGDIGALQFIAEIVKKWRKAKLRKVKF